MESKETKTPLMSEEDAVNILNNLDEATLSKLRMMSKWEAKPWARKHNHARSERAKARILKRKGKWNGLSSSKKSF